MKNVVCRIGWVVAPALALLAGSTLAGTDGERAAQDVGYRLTRNDCAGAVEALNAGLKQGHAEVALLAGSMYENGICVRSDWKRAVSFYAEAYEGGQKKAASRLAAGFAAPENGPDIAAALWWAQRGRVMAAPMQANVDCAISAAASGDPDLFVAELRTWPQARLLYCNYIAGVMSTISAEVQYPKQALRRAVGGSVVLRFQPAVPKIDMLQDESREYKLLAIADGNTLLDRTAKRDNASFDTVVGDVADRALRRYPQPAGIPAGTQIQVKYTFNIIYTP